jgi:cytochrome P450
VLLLGNPRTVLRRDRSLDFLAKGYPAIAQMRAAASRSGAAGTAGEADGAEVSLLGRKTLCVGGAAGVRLFYDETLTTRRGALPGPVRSVLFGDGAVHGADGGAHRQRKALFLSLLGPKAARDLALIADRRWQVAGGRWQVAVTRWRSDGKPVLLFDQAVGVLGSAVCEWAGVPPDRQGPDQYGDLATIVDGFGSVGLRHLSARRARSRADRWGARLIDDTRSGQIEIPESAALASIARWSDENGNPLDISVTAVELLNVLRPATAVFWFVVFAALALENHPDWRIGCRRLASRKPFRLLYTKFAGCTRLPQCSPPEPVPPSTGAATMLLSANASYSTYSGLCTTRRPGRNRSDSLPSVSWERRPQPPSPMPMFPMVGETPSMGIGAPENRPRSLFSRVPFGYWCRPAIE